MTSRRDTPNLNGPGKLRYIVEQTLSLLYLCTLPLLSVEIGRSRPGDLDEELVGHEPS
ncbi:hypothetical protein [Streptomyces aureus]|uniref:hypothetical protein n=1 Tax=Streptomyces aureus TaxID=193461 RepID=UPI000ABBE586|nr:hypothetical protein [Streptomyces aureus]